MPKYIIKDGKARKVDEKQKVDEVKVEEEKKTLDEKKSLYEYTVDELKEIAEDCGIKTSGKKKQELIEEIKAVKVSW